MCYQCVCEQYEYGAHPNHIEPAEQINQQASNFGYTVANATSISYSDASQYISTVLTGPSWSSSPGTAAIVTYSFDFSAADSNIVYSNNPYAFNSTEQDAARQAMASISEVVNITFVEASSSSDANIHFYNGDLTGSNIAGISGYFYIGDEFTASTVGMDDQSANFTSGTWMYETLLHEIGHAIGLKHPGNYSGSEDGPFLSSDLDTTENTVMSYNDAGEYKTTMQEIDIAALQYLYGGSGFYGETTTTTTTTGTTGGDGNDALVGGDSGEDIKGGLGSDNILGGGGNDTLYGGRAIADADDSPDTIKGGTGDDLIFGNTGGDTIYGGETTSSTGDGVDTIYGGLGMDLIYGNDGDDSLAGGGGIAHPQDDPDTIYGGGGNDSIVGNGGNDTIYGDADSDTIWGGLGDDSIYGGDGNDLIIGQIGDEYLYGNGGADVFYFYGADGIDAIMDFESGTDTIRLTSGINGTNISSGVTALQNVQVIDSDWTALVLDSSFSNVLYFYQLSGSLSINDFEFV